MVQASRKITENRLKWYGHVRRMKEEHTMRRMLDVEIPGKGKKGAAKPKMGRCMYERDMTEARLKDDNATNRAEWRKKLINYTGDPR